MRASGTYAAPFCRVMRRVRFFVPWPQRVRVAGEPVSEPALPYPHRRRGGDHRHATAAPEMGESARGDPRSQVLRELIYLMLAAGGPRRIIRFE